MATGLSAITFNAATVDLSIYGYGGASTGNMTNLYVSHFWRNRAYATGVCGEASTPTSKLPVESLFVVGRAFG